MSNNNYTAWETTAERMKEAWTAQRGEPRSENKLPRFDASTDKTDWIVKAFFVGTAETAEPKKAKAKKAKGASAEQKEPEEATA